jgi:hypothetical protein
VTWSEQSLDLYCCRCAFVQGTLLAASESASLEAGSDLVTSVMHFTVPWNDSNNTVIQTTCRFNSASNHDDHSTATRLGLYTQNMNVVTVQGQKPPSERPTMDPLYALNKDADLNLQHYRRLTDAIANQLSDTDTQIMSSHQIHPHYCRSLLQHQRFPGNSRSFPREVSTNVPTTTK